MVGLNPDVGRFFLCVVTIIFVANTTVAFGKYFGAKIFPFIGDELEVEVFFLASFLSAASPSINVALAISGPILVPLMIFSGFFLNNE